MAIVESFIEGFSDFKKNYHHGSDSLYAELHKAQNPGAIVVACCDSRVDPAILLGCAPGDIFVVRNIANLVPHCDAAAPQDSTIAALAYGVMHLHINDIVVLGHSDCGGIKALCSLEADSVQPQLGAWLKTAHPALDATLEHFPDLPRDQLQEACQFTAVLLSMDNMLSWPWIRERVEQGTLRLHPWFFDMKHGDLLCYDRQSHSFELLDHSDKLASL